MKQPIANSPLVSALVFLGAMAIAFMLTKSSYALPLLATGLPALHGALTAKSALQAQSSSTNSRNVTLELMCAGGLGMAFLVVLIGRENVFGWLLGWGIAAIATLVLVVSTALELRQRRRHQSPHGETKSRLIIQSGALLIYSLLVLWMASVAALWLVVWLSGEPYMGN